MSCTSHLVIIHAPEALRHALPAVLAAFLLNCRRRWTLLCIASHREIRRLDSGGRNKCKKSTHFSKRLYSTFFLLDLPLPLLSRYTSAALSLRLAFDAPLFSPSHFFLLTYLQRSRRRERNELWDLSWIGGNITNFGLHFHIYGTGTAVTRVAYVAA